jgi:phosphohistidine phosphatase SixA
LDLNAIERVLGSTTMRTQGTVEQLAAKYFAG